MASKSPQKEAVLTLVGFKQTGFEAEKGGLNYTPCISRGYFEKQTDSYPLFQPNSRGGHFVPSKETTVRDCPNYCGHSGGPVLDERGEVVGILSRGDIVDENLCYVVPQTELKRLLQKAEQVQEAKEETKEAHDMNNTSTNRVSNIIIIDIMILFKKRNLQELIHSFLFSPFQTITGNICSR